MIDIDINVLKKKPTKEHKEVFGDDKYIQYFGCDAGIMDVCIFPNQ